MPLARLMTGRILSCHQTQLEFSLRKKMVQCKCQETRLINPTLCDTSQGQLSSPLGLPALKSRSLIKTLNHCPLIPVQGKSRRGSGAAESDASVERRHFHDSLWRQLFTPANRLSAHALVKGASMEQVGGRMDGKG